MSLLPPGNETRSSGNQAIVTAHVGYELPTIYCRLGALHDVSDELFGMWHVKCGMYHVACVVRFPPLALYILSLKISRLGSADKKKEIKLRAFDITILQCLHR